MSTAPVHVAPSPMSLGDVLGAMFSVVRRRIGAFLALAGLQQLAIGIAVTIPIVLSAIVIYPSLLAGESPSSSAVGAGLLVLVGGFFIAALVAGVASLYFDGMMITCANEATQERFPTMTELRALNKGYVGRIVGLYLLGMLAYFVGAALVTLPMFLSVLGMIGLSGDYTDINGNEAFVSVMGGLLLSMLLMLAFAAGAFLVGVKLAYVAQVCAVERLSGFTALRRAWDLTKGAFWRTFLYLFVFSLIAGTAQQAISVMMNFFSHTMTSMTSSSSPGSAVLSVLRSGTFLVMLSAVVGIAILIQVAMVPLRIAFVTVMYGDQLRRHQLGPVNHAFAVNMPGYVQGYGYPQAGYGHPQADQHPGYGGQPTYRPYGQQPPFGEG